MAPMLRLHEDVMTGGGALSLPALPRMIFVAHGTVVGDERTLRDEDVFAGESQLTLTAGDTGATLWRWELVMNEATGAGGERRGVVTREKLGARLDTLPDGPLLLRGDGVAFPPGGCAFLHRHQGPGIRCLMEGGIRIDTHGASTAYGPGGAWYESGPDPVFAQAADRPTRFIRVMILPRAYLGKSSLEYLLQEDKPKPKSQSYKLYADLPLTAAAAG